MNEKQLKIVHIHTKEAENILINYKNGFFFVFMWFWVILEFYIIVCYHVQVMKENSRLLIGVCCGDFCSQ